MIPQHFSNPVHSKHTYLPMKMEQSVPKRWHIKFRRRGITQKKAYNIQKMVKVWKQELYMFQAVPLPIIRSFPLYIQHWYVIQFWWQLSSTTRMEPVPSRSCLKAVIKPAWHIPVPNVQWKTPDDGQRNCLKHVVFLNKNKFGKLVFLLVLLKRNLLWCTVTWM